MSYLALKELPTGYTIPPPTTAYKYTVVPETAGLLAVTAQELRDCLRLDVDSLTDGQAEDLILSAQLWAENYAGFVLFKSTVTTFRNSFPSIGFELRRYPVVVADPVVISYSIDQVLTVLATTVYLLAERSFFSVLFLKEGEYWPVDADAQADTVKIVFNAGFGAAPADIPFDIKRGIKTLAVYLHENPGDCNSCAGGSVSFPPEAARLLGFRKPLKV